MFGNKHALCLFYKARFRFVCSLLVLDGGSCLLVSICGRFFLLLGMKSESVDDKYPCIWAMHVDSFFLLFDNITEFWQSWLASDYQMYPIFTRIVDVHTKCLYSSVWLNPRERVSKSISTNFAVLLMPKNKK